MAHRPGVGDLVKAIEVESQPLLAQGVAPAPLITGDDLVAIRTLEGHETHGVVGPAGRGLDLLPSSQL